MNRVRVNIGEKSYNCQVFKSQEDKEKGLMEIEYLAPDEGALFVWEDEGTREMWMKNTKIPLDLIAINDDDEVVLVYAAQPEDETLVPFMDAKYILEVNANSGIVEGDDFEIEEELDEYVMKVLAPDGSTQMLLQGGERICSRKHSKVLIKKAKKAEEVKGNKNSFDKKCKALGKYIFKVFKTLDEREPEYVESPSKKE